MQYGHKILEKIQGEPLVGEHDPASWLTCMYSLFGHNRPVEKHAGCSIRHKVKGGCHTSTTNAVMVATIKEAGRSSHNLLSRARRNSASALCTRTLFLILFAKSMEAIGITI